MFNYYSEQLESISINIRNTEAKLKELEKFKLTLVKMRQEVCEHKNTQTTDSFDYHNRVDWVETHCTDCGKYLGKK